MPAAAELAWCAVSGFGVAEESGSAPRRISPGKTTHFINPANGSDTASGLERKLAWRTFERVIRLRLSPGDRIEIIAPGAFERTLMLTGAGTAEAPVDVSFAPGRYDLHPAKAFRHNYQISNTNGDPDGGKAVGILLKDARHFRIAGPGAKLVYRGKMIEVCIDRSHDILVTGLEFDYHRPAVSEFKVAATGDGYTISKSTRIQATRSKTARTLEHLRWELQGGRW